MRLTLVLICQDVEEVAKCHLDLEIGLIGHHGLLVQLLVVIKQLNNDQDYAFLNLAMVMTLRLVLVLICPCVLLLGLRGLPVLQLVEKAPDTVQEKMKLKLMLVRIYQNVMVIFKCFVLTFHIYNSFQDIGPTGLNGQPVQEPVMMMLKT